MLYYCQFRRAARQGSLTNGSNQLDLREWADMHGETDSFDPDPWVCIDGDQVAVEAGERVAAAWGAWEDAACDEDPARREWLAMLTAVDRAEVAIEAAPECGCYECRVGRRTVFGYRVDAFTTAGEFGLPRPPVDGRIPRYPVNVGTIREKAERLVSAGRVHRVTDGVYVVDGDTGAYYVHAAGLDPLEWACSCPWAQPQPDASGRPGRGCAHTVAAHRVDVAQAAAAAARQAA